MSFTGPTLPLQRRRGVNPQPHALIAAVVGSSLASGEREGRGVAWETCLLWTVSAGERATPLQQPPPPPRFPVLFCAALRSDYWGSPAGIIRAAIRLSRRD